MQPVDRLGRIGAALEGRLHARPPRTQQLGDPVPGEAEVQSNPRFARRLAVPLTIVDEPLALPYPSGRGQFADNILPQDSLEATGIDDLEEQKNLGLFLQADQHITLDVAQFQFGRGHFFAGRFGGPRDRSAPAPYPPILPSNPMSRWSSAQCNTFPPLSVTGNL